MCMYVFIKDPKIWTKMKTDNNTNEENVSDLLF